MATARSVQEELLRLYSEQSVGAPFVFHPERYGRNSEEPADVVWACNGCVVLMYAKKMKTYDNEVKNESKTAKLIPKNLSQARRWMGDWKAGQPLKGHNSYGDFNIAFGEFPFVVILSIIETGSSMAQYHPEHAKLFGTAICATIPYSIMSSIASREGSMLDLLSILVYLKEQQRIISEAELQKQLDGYWQSAQQQAGITPRLSDPFYVDSLNQARTTLYIMREPKVQDVGQVDKTTAQLFNDFRIVQYYLIQRIMADIMETVREDPRKWGCALIPFDASAVIVGGTLIQSPDKVIAASHAQVERAKALGITVLAILLFFHVQMNEEQSGISPVVMVLPHDKPSQTEITMRRLTHMQSATGG